MADFDVIIIGGGVNGTGIARDAAGRGLRVLLLEQNDLASGTSSGSTKLFHGGLRYLEYYEFNLVRQALKEREVLLANMPHISWPLRFILPHHRGLRPAWFLRLGLYVYDYIGGRKFLPATKTLKLARDVVGKPLKSEFTKAFEYSDCWVNDARLVALNARDAATRGATIMTRAKCTWMDYVDGQWVVEYETVDGVARATSTLAVNAAGPWLETVLENAEERQGKFGLRLVRGSHVVVPKLFEHDKPYIFQQADGRIIFAIPYENDYTLIGTTDADHIGTADKVECSVEEAAYLCEAASQYFKAPVRIDDIVWKYSAVRPLLDDGKKNAASATRDYIVRWHGDGSRGPLLNIYGGKITTYRKLSEKAVGMLVNHFPDAGDEWTTHAPMPGGDFPIDGVATVKQTLLDRFAFLDEKWADRLTRAYGTDAALILDDATSTAELGVDFGATLYEREVVWLMQKEFAKRAEDVVWRRSKLGLRMDATQIETLDEWMIAFQK
jgi:glycerol-3-phosphate dehydrogenase